MANMTYAEIYKKIEGLEAKLRWLNLPKHMADAYKLQIETLKNLLKQKPPTGG